MAAAGSTRDPDMNCSDFSLFQEILRKMRTLDDRIVYALNHSIPTQSFSGKQDATEQCKSLFKQLTDAHLEREGLIKGCVAQQSKIVQDCRQKKKENMDDIEVLKSLRKEQTTLREMQSELNVEEVVQERTRTIFHERCRTHYIPPKK